MKLIYYLLFGLFLLLVSPQCIFGQISIANTITITENFDAIGSVAAAPLPSYWKISSAATTSPAWNDVNNFTTTNFAASSGSPVNGGKYNWGKTGGTDRSTGFISSGTYPSPNSIMAWYRNTNIENLVSLTVSYDLFQFRINTGVPTVTFYYSTDGSTWTSVTSGDV